jgi:hypothetical protein
MPDLDLNDGKDWSAVDLFDLRTMLESGETIEEIARFLCRSKTVDEVREKANEFGIRDRV